MNSAIFAVLVSLASQNSHTTRPAPRVYRSVTVAVESKPAAPAQAPKATFVFEVQQ
jgi:hypothetical protein